MTDDLSLALQRGGLPDQFDRAWRDGTPPRIEEYAVRLGSDSTGRELLAELVQIDLEYRWRRKPTGGNPWVLEDYAKRLAALTVSAELAGWEYRVRHCWGDRPNHAEYRTRFPQHAAVLPAMLARIDAELAREQARQISSIQEAPVAAPAPVPVSVTDLLTFLRQGSFLSSAQTDELQYAPAADARTLARLLLERGWLTPYQVNQLLQGRGSDLLLGPYLLLDRLGEGGAGQVFKARHQKMNRVVALKVIRPDLLTDPEAVGRFRREIQVLSALDHPNVVHAYDAGPINSPSPLGGEGGVRGYYLAMEYVEGTDLARLVKQCGPLPVMQACAYVRQAALGLQHAHEKGLVHRDIKPHNLILSMREGLIKVADLGLARLPRAANEEATAALTGAANGSSLTPVGAVAMGTLDYLAPEQALDFHAADIRADIYSLGCTLWCLLTGQPPFPTGTLAEKLLAHQSKELPAINQLRADIASDLSGVVKRMLAKQPDDRYQTPADLAEAILPFISNSCARELGIHSGGWSVRGTASSAWELLRIFARRHKVFTATATTALVLVAGSSVINYQARRETEKAVKELREERKRTLAAVPAFVEAARLAVDRQRLDNALAQVNVALDYDPEYAEARLLKAQILIVQREFGRAKEELERYLKQQPRDREAARLVELCGRKRPDEVGTLLDFAHVFEKQKMPALGDALLTRYGRSSFEARQWLLKRYQARIEKAWPGLGNHLSQDAAGIYRLNLAEKLGMIERLDALEGMPLTELNLTGSGVTDLEPLKGMPLTALNLDGCRQLKDITALQGLPLTFLDLTECAVEDLTPLQRMPLNTLKLIASQVSDLTPLKGMKLKHILLSPHRITKGMEVLRHMNGLESITPFRVGLPTQYMPARDFWQRYDAGRKFK